MQPTKQRSSLWSGVGWVWLTCLAGVSWPNDALAQPLSVSETDAAIVVRNNVRDMVTYNKVSPPAPAGIDHVYKRSGCLHPVAAPSGRTVTQMFPADHPHQHGVFTAWVRTTYDGQMVDFWNLAGGTGTVLHERVIGTFQEAGRAGFEVDLLHRMTGQLPVDILRERWKVTVYATDGGYHCFDLQTTQSALTDKPLVVSKYHYGGLAVRGPISWLAAKDQYVREHPELGLERSGFLNDRGSDRIDGNHQHARWVAMTGDVDGAAVTIAVLSHAENFRAPQAARLHPSKPYFCFAPCVDEAFVIDREHPLTGRYRFLITDAAPDVGWLNQQWEAWCQGRRLPRPGLRD